MHCTHPHYKGQEVFVVVLRAAAEDVQTLMIPRPSQLTDSKLHPEYRDGEDRWVESWSCVCVRAHTHDLRNWAVTVALNGLQQLRGRRLFTQVVVGVCY